jgi:hypothetical protein
LTLFFDLTEQVSLSTPSWGIPVVFSTLVHFQIYSLSLLH